ncbi:MAG: hypothetical protein II655_12450, partial [Thermoguttaceae bacterium]|nr:hypothetical protein [Thermoguttaceae bacterium]
MQLNRRTLLKTALVASPMLVASRVLGLDGETAPSERVRLGVVGLGGRGSYIATIIQQYGTMRRPHAISAIWYGSKSTDRSAVST